MRSVGAPDMASSKIDSTGRRDLAHDLFLPTLLFSALGAMTWAVRGCAGAGGMNACVAPGLTWGVAWWYLARRPGAEQDRRYASGWIVLALTAGFAIAGERGWMQWPAFYEGKLLTNFRANEFVPISKSYGYLWFFLAGSAWAALPACLLAWCASGCGLRAWEWTLRLACGFGAGYLAWRLFARFPQVFLPLYTSIEGKYHDLKANPNLIKLIRDNASSVRQVGFCLGFVLFETVRKDWKNVTLISVVGVVNGIGWALVRNWSLAPRIWPDARFNFGRCWESSGGITIGLAFGIAYFLVNRRQPKLAPAEADPPDHWLAPREWLLTALLLILIGWTQFWAPAHDLRTVAPPPQTLLGYSWGLVLAIIGAGYFTVVYWLYRRNGAPLVSGRSAFWDLEWWLGFGLMVVFGWFIRLQLRDTYGDGVADGALAGWASPGAMFFFVILGYGVARRLVLALGLAPPGLARIVAGRRLDANVEWLVTYVSLGLILLWCIGVGMVTGWPATEWYGVVGAIYAVVSLIAMSRRRPDDDLQSGDFRHERWGLWVALVYGLGLSLRKGLKGGAHLYVGNENAWDTLFWYWVAVGMLACLLGGLIWILGRRFLRSDRGDLFPHAYGVFWVVLVAQNVLAQVVTGPIWGPRASWNEMAFSIFYVVLFFITAVIAYHYHYVRTHLVGGAPA